MIPMRFSRVRAGRVGRLKAKACRLQAELLEDRRLLTAIPIVNPGFEADTPSVGYHVRAIQGWVITITQHNGTSNPTTAQFPGLAPQGTNVAYIGPQTTSPISQVLSSNLSVGGYTLQVDVGKRLDFGYAGYDIQLIAGSTVLAEDNNTLNPAPGTFVTSTVTFSAQAGNPALGQPLRILIAAPGAAPDGVQTDFDDVRLDYVPSSSAPASQAQVSDGGTALANGTGSDAYGSTPVGTPVTRTFTVTNAGTADLTLGAPVSLPAGFSLAAGFGATTVPAGGTTTFAVRFDATAIGSSGGQVSFATNDPAATTYTFAVSATATGPVQVMDDGDPGFAVVGPWIPFAGQGFGGDVRYIAAGTGANTASWTFSGLTPGQYRVSATWSPFSNRATDAPYTVLDGSTTLATVAVDQQLTPAGLTDQGAAWQDLGGPYTITGTTLTVRLSDNANNYVIADAVRIERLGDAAPAPRAGVLDGSTAVADNTGSVGFGSTPAGTAVTRTFTVTNTGTAPLNLGAITVPSGFTLAAGFGAPTVAPGGTTTFAVRFDATAAGSFSGQVSFVTDDAAANPYAFAVSATAAAPPAAVQVMDDTDARFTVVGPWRTSQDGQGFGGDVRYIAAGTGADTATWTFSGLTPGRYRVSATWTPFFNRATDAPFTVLDGSTALATVAVNQQLAPAGLTDQGAAWQDLGGPYTITGTTLTVRLSDNANNYVIADAVRIERVGDLPNGPLVRASDGGTALANGTGSDAYGSTPVGTPVTRTFTVTNAGTADLTLGAPVSLPAGFSLAAGFGATTVPAGGTTTFAVRFDATAIGSSGGQVSFATNDPAATTYTFAVSATATGPVQVMDDGDRGFAVVGPWTPFAGQGFGGDVRYIAAGTGANTASWTFSGLTPGRYRVSATWSPFSNRATDAPYTVLDGSTTLATVAVDQQLTPAGLTDQGAAWQDLGGPYTITGTTLTVRLSDNANNYVIADAVRIERIG